MTNNNQVKNDNDCFDTESHCNNCTSYCIACFEMILASHSVGHCSYKVNKKNRWREKYIYFGSIRVQKGNNFVLNA